MNQSNNKSAPRGPGLQFKPLVVQTKFRTVAQKSSPAPPVAYRPQPVPKVLQLKRHEVRATPAAQNVARSSSNPPAQLKAAPKTGGNQPSNVHQHQPGTTNRVTKSPGVMKPSCVQAKTNAWSMRKPLPGNVGPGGIRRGNTIQRSEGAVAVKEVAKDDVKHAAKLSEMAAKLHAIAGGTSQNTTGVGKLKNGKLIAYTQLSADKIKEAAQAMGIDHVANTKGAGYHVEVSMFIDYGDNLQAVGASQGFCPHCKEFLIAKGITRIGVDRPTKDQVWYSPEFYNRKEKSPISAPYPWAYMKDEVQGKRVTYVTRAAYLAMFKEVTGGSPDWMSDDE